MGRKKETKRKTNWRAACVLYRVDNCVSTGFGFCEVSLSEESKARDCGVRKLSSVEDSGKSEPESQLKARPLVEI